MSKKPLFLILLSASALVLALAILVSGGYFALGTQQVKLGSIDQILAIERGKVAQSERTSPPGKVVVIDEVKIDGDWAITEGHWIDQKTGEPWGGEGGIDIYRKVNGKWTTATSGTDTYKKWLDEIPGTLISREIKPFLR